MATTMYSYYYGSYFHLRNLTQSFAQSQQAFALDYAIFFG